MNSTTYKGNLKLSEYKQLLVQERLILEATELIEEMMKDKGVNRKWLADQLGVSKSHISQLLSGERNMTLITLAKIANVFDKQIRLSVNE
jgi:antitoxin component HigA of HigAB toxin-antitoxin module